MRVSASLSRFIEAEEHGHLPPQAWQRQSPGMGGLLQSRQRSNSGRVERETTVSATGARLMRRPGASG